MDELIEQALGLLAPEEQVAARNRIYELSRTGFFKAIELAGNTRILQILPQRLVEPDDAKVALNEMAERGIILRFATAVARVGIAPGERQNIKGSIGIK